jgi:abortive infection bacteriophage resistance protein
MTIDNSKTSFNKPALSRDEHIDWLSDRGLIISAGETLEKEALHKVGYYRLSGYFKAFQNASEQFHSNTTFEQVLEVYFFDKKLRILTFEVLENFEVSLRASITNSLSLEHGPQWFENPDCFQRGKHAPTLEKISETLGDKRRNAQPLKHFYRKYNEKYPPSWMLLETFSFGKLHRHIYRNLKSKFQRQIAKDFDYNERLFDSFLHSLTYIRNLCAHHDRIWNRSMTIRPTYPLSKPEKDILAGTRQDSFYPVAFIIHMMLEKISVSPNQWAPSLEALFKEFSSIDLARLGFPPNWSPDIWKPTC